MNLAEFKALVEQRGPVVRDGGDWRGRCPAHADDGKRGDLTFRAGDDGRIILHCWGGCDAKSVVSSLGLQWSDLFSENGHSRPQATQKPQKQPTVYPTYHGAVEAIAAFLGGEYAGDWTYHTASGDEAMYVVRFDGCKTLNGRKAYRPIHPALGGYVVLDPKGPLPLYNLPRILADSDIPVFITEGEKAADAGRKIGLLCTTSSHGADGVQKADWTPLAGRDCIILPDCDKAGETYAEKVAEALASLTPPASVKVVRLPGLSVKGDLFDYIEQSEAEDVEAIRANILSLAAETPVTEPPSKVTKPPVEIAPVGFGTVTASSEFLSHEQSEPFPAEALPEPLKAFVCGAADAIGCDESYVGLPLLVGLAGAIGNTRRIELKRGWREPAVLWGAIVGESGTQKSPALEVALKPVRRRQHETMKRHAERVKEYEAALLCHDKALAQWKKSGMSLSAPPEKPEEPQAERLWCDDITIEGLAALLLNNPRGLLLIRDELAGWLGGFDRYARGKGSDASRWLEMYGARAVVVDRKTGASKTIYIPRAAVSIIGGIQPGALHRALGTEHLENGLAARLLLTCPSRKPKTWGEADIPPAMLQRIEGVFERLYTLEMVRSNEDLCPLDLPLSSGAKRAWVRFYNEHGKEQSDLDGDLAATWSKLEGGAARLALVIHLSRWAANDSALTDGNVVDQQSIESGICLSRWFGAEARKVYGILSETPEQRELRRLIDRIQSRGGAATLRELTRSLHIPAATVEQSLNRLVAAGVGRWEHTKPSETGGRPVSRFLMTIRGDSDKTPDDPMNGGFVTNQGGSVTGKGG